MSRRTVKWRKVIGGLKGLKDRIGEIVPSQRVIGKGRYLRSQEKGPGPMEVCSLPMGMEKVARIRKLAGLAR